MDVKQQWRLSLTAFVTLIYEQINTRSVSPSEKEMSDTISKFFALINYISMKYF